MNSMTKELSKEERAIAKAMQPSLIDKVVGYFNPVKGLQRQQARAVSAITGSYTGASRKGSWARSWITPQNDATNDLHPDLPTLRNRCRDLVRNNPVASGAVSTVVTNVVGTGLTVQCNIDSDYLGLTEEQTEAWQANTEREWKLYSESKNCDLTRKQNFAGLQALAFRSSLENGDSFAVLPDKSVPGFPYTTRVQLIESDQVCNKDSKPDSKNCAGGIVIDDNGAPQKIQIMTTHPGSSNRERKWTEIDIHGSRTGRLGVIHLVEYLRIGQLRGAPYLAPVIEPLKQISRYTEAELMAAVVSGLFTVFIKSEGGQGAMLGGADIDNTAQDQAQSRDYQLGNGMIIEGLPGDSIETINPGRPNDSFDPFVQAIFKQIGVALELPYEVLMKAYLSSYSAARGAMLDAWRFFRKRRTWLATNFCQPVYETWLAEAVAKGRIQAPGFFENPAIRAAYTRALWHGDGPGSIDPMKEANAAEKRMSIKLTNLSQEKSAYDGGDWEQTVRQRKKELREGAAIEGKEPVAPEPYDPDNPQ